ncbi:ATP-binding protein [Macrococcus hajekii]|uniref:histidine kinase n=1 Tax=Macrococcus hajekii TaxID=198482 RepID=A0A4R6BIC3_9STAP|nr:ATP-binding protein [Macrococcus hajekii]TDM01369.1 ATP-binding protein [Macrococcus hajekii]GGB11020.1 hypothetical protein GCM10007190_18920 [Macrococcus hajekii]
MEEIQPFKQNKSALERIITNIIDNTLKLSAPGTDIRIIAIETLHQSIQIKVMDERKGIAAENLNRIFERIYRVEHSRNQATGGSGLGLYIAKTLAHQIDGSITVDSQIVRVTVF